MERGRQNMDEQETDDEEEGGGMQGICHVLL
jgi:hypothetical protein